MKKNIFYLVLIFWSIISPFKGQASTLNIPQIQNTVKSLTAEQEKIVSATFPDKFPLTTDDLRMVYVEFLGFDNKAHQGTLIVNQSVANDVLKVFQKLNKEKFPIRRMDAIFGLQNIKGNNLSIYEQDNTVAFHARKEVSNRDKWSQHAYGLAVDLNPVENPYVSRKSITPPAGKNFLNRNEVRMGMVALNNVAYNAFAEIGWKWGGNWRTIKDYMHFSKTGK